MNIKKSSELKISDFLDYPLWTWEDDGDSLTPIINQTKIFNEYNAVFVKCEIIMQDGTKINGAVAVRTSNNDVYLVSFPLESGSLLDVPLQPLLSEQKDLQLKKLCKQLNKHLEDIFPIEFTTTFKLNDETLLKGIIEI